MRIYLVNPPAPKGVKMVREGRCMQRKGAWTAVWAPISLATIGAILEKESFEVKLSDCIVENIDFNKLEELIREFQPQLVIINTATPSIESDLAVAETAKNIDQKIVTAAFGIHVTALPEKTLNINKSLDLVIRGEPEMTVKEIASLLAEGKDFKQAEGISYLQNNKINHNSDRPLIQNLDQLPFPAWHLTDVSKYILPFKNKPFLLVDTGRGCPYYCHFCSAGVFYGHQTRLRSVKNLVDELAWVKKNHNVEEFLFWTESFTLNREYANEVCREIIRRNLKISFVCNSRVNGIDEELLLLLKKAGCWMIGYGVESGNQMILDRANKKTTLEEIRRAVEIAKKAGLEVTGHVIFGLPGETKETMAETLQFCLDIDLDFAQFYCAVPFPGSQFYQESIKNGWIKDFSWPNFEQNSCVLSYGALSGEEIMNFRRKAFRRIYLQPKKIMKNLKRLNSFGEIKNFFSMLREFITWL
jgi:anaerobic magnesium-protoporphyrin IX monomethyl ester cyclase